MMTNRNEWTAPLIDRMTVLWQTRSASESVVLINKEFGTSFTRNAIIGKLHRLGLTVEHKGRLHPKTRENGHARPKKAKVPGGGSVGSVAYGIIHKIKAKQDELGAPDAPLKLRPDAADLEPRHITLLELTNQTCRWIYGAPGNWTYCGCEKISEGPYCYSHDPMSKPPVSARKAVPDRRAA